MPTTREWRPRWSWPRLMPRRWSWCPWMPCVNTPSTEHTWGAAPAPAASPAGVKPDQAHSGRNMRCVTILGPADMLTFACCPNWARILEGLRAYNFVPAPRATRFLIGRLHEFVDQLRGAGTAHCLDNKFVMICWQTPFFVRLHMLSGQHGCIRPSFREPWSYDPANRSAVGPRDLYRRHDDV